MALDTRDKRASALLAGLRGGLLPAADGAVDQADRQQLSTTYRGLLAQYLGDDDERASMIGLGLPFGFPLPSPAGSLSQRERQQVSNCYRGVLAQSTDVTDRRASMIGSGLPFGFPLPRPRGVAEAPSQPDRQQLIFCYRGILAQALAATQRRASMLGLGLPLGFPLPSPTGLAEAPNQFDRQQLANSYAGILGATTAGGITDAILVGNEVVELAADGTEVGTVVPIGGHPPLSFALSEDAGGAFAIDADTAVITVADGSLLDFDTSPADKLITVEISDGSPPFTKSFTIVVLDAAGPTDITMGNQSVSEHADDGTLVGTASAVGGIPPYSYGFTFSGNPSNLFAIDSSTGAVTIAHGSPLDFGVSPSPQITIEVADSEGKVLTKTFTITVAAAGQVIQAAGGTPDDVEEAYALVTEDGATIVLPEGTFEWTRGITIPSSGFSVHIRGADWQPASGNYLTAQTDAQALTALEDFQPLTKITTTGSGADVTLFTIDIPNVTISRVWGVGRKTKSDIFVRINDQTDAVVYWNRMEWFDECVQLWNAPGRTLVTHNVGNGFEVEEGQVVPAFSLAFNSNALGTYESIDAGALVGTFNMPYLQYNFMRLVAHPCDWTRGACVAVRYNNMQSTSGGTLSGYFRLHGYYVFGDGGGDDPPQQSGRLAEIYGNVYWKQDDGAGTGRHCDWAGGAGVFHNNTMLPGSGGNNMLLIRYEATARQGSSPDNPTCGELNAANYPYPQQPAGPPHDYGVWFWNNDEKGTPLTLATLAFDETCAGKIMEVGRDIFDEQPPGYAPAGTHPLMPPELTA